MTSARSDRDRTSGASEAASKRGLGEAVEEMTRSLAPTASRAASKGTTSPPNSAANRRAFASVRLVTPSRPRPRPSRARAVRVPILPVPTRSTRAPERSPRILEARSTPACPAESTPSLTPVSRRTRLPTFRAKSKRRPSSGPQEPASRARARSLRTCPWISVSPRICESSPLVTRKRCSTACSPARR